MDQFEKLLPSLLNLHHSDVVSFHHSTDDSGHLSIYVTLNRRLSSCPYCGSNKVLSNGFYNDTVNEKNTKNVNLNFTTYVAF